jgi:ribosomal protein L12E/L44/L45/RPP1/RPP2
MKHAVLTIAFAVSIVSTLSFATPRSALAGSSLENLIRSQVMAAQGAAAAKAGAAAQAKAAMEAKAATANGYGAMPALSVACPPSSHWALADHPDRCL